MKKRNVKAIGVFLLLGIMCFDLLFMDVKVQAAIQGLEVTYHSQIEIAEYIYGTSDSLIKEPSFAVTHSVENPYVVGNLSLDTKNTALNILNNVRYVAGLQNNVVLDDTYGKYAQAAALINAHYGVLSHHPVQPSDMPDDLYTLCNTGAGASNLSVGRINFYATILYGWMADEDESNISRVGHRRWILNPSMAKTGFGCATSNSSYSRRFYAVYAFDSSGSGKETNVAWPAQQMPTDFFEDEYPWSLSTGNIENRSLVEVKLTSMTTGKTWLMSSSTDSLNSSSWYFNVDNSCYGQAGCIIFRPNNISVDAGNSYKVTISGTTKGTIEYTVNFFDMEEVYLAAHPELRTSQTDSQTTPSSQTISGTSTYKKTVGDKAFTLNAKGKTALSYSSSNKKVATANDKGKVTIKGTGTTTITVTAKATDKYQKATKKITVKVGKLKSTTLSSVKKSGSKKLKVAWKKYSNADGYEVQYATKKDFSKSATKSLKVKKAKTTTTTIKKLKAKRTYYVRVRTYKKVNGKTYYSNWSKVKSQKTK